MYLKYDLIVKNYHLQFQALERDINRINTFNQRYEYEIFINKKKYTINLIDFTQFFNTYLIDSFKSDITNDKKVQTLKLNQYLTIEGYIPKNPTDTSELITLLNMDEDKNDYQHAKNLAEIYSSKKYNITESKLLFIFLERIIDIMIDTEDSKFINKNFNVNIFFFLFFLKNIKITYQPYPINSIKIDDSYSKLDNYLDNYPYREYYESNNLFF